MFVNEKIESHQETKDKLLQFLPFSSVVESTFWHKLSLLKIDVYALKDEPVDIQGYYTAIILLLGCLHFSTLTILGLISRNHHRRLSYHTIITY